MKCQVIFPQVNEKKKKIKKNRMLSASILNDTDTLMVLFFLILFFPRE